MFSLALVWFYGSSLAPSCIRPTVTQAFARSGSVHFIKTPWQLTLLLQTVHTTIVRQRSSANMVTDLSEILLNHTQGTVKQQQTWSSQLSQRILGLLLGTGDNIGQSKRRARSNHPRNNCGTNFCSSSLFVCKLANAS